MRKSLFLLAVLFLVSGSAFAVDVAVINLKAGIDVAGNLHCSSREAFVPSEDFDVKPGFTIAGEYLFKLSNAVNFGAGIEYLPCIKDKTGAKSSFAPIYLSIEVAPIPTFRGLFFKTNLGYNLHYDNNIDYYDDKSGYFYFGIGTGYLFPSGIFLEGVYSFYLASSKYLGESGFWHETDITYSALGLKVGYRVNI